MKEELDELIASKVRAERIDKKHTKQEIVALFSAFGYQVPNGARIWKLTDPEHSGGYGMEVGSYVHSCHIDTTDFKVLLVVDGAFHGVESYGDLWLRDLVVI